MGAGDFRYPVYAFSRQMYDLGGRCLQNIRAKHKNPKRQCPNRAYICNEKLRTQDMENPGPHRRQPVRPKKFTPPASKPTPKWSNK